MSTLEDKILDGPRVHYCEADDDDIRENESEDASQDNSSGSPTVQRGNASDLFRRPDDEAERLELLDNCNWRIGGSTNTGPKGVIEDCRKRQLELQAGGDNDQLDQEFQELMNDDSYIRELISRRLAEAASVNIPTFGQVFRLQTGEQLLEAIDKENPNVLVIVHIYTRTSRSCSRLNRCLDELADDLKNLKFVTLDASVTNLSYNFKENGVPAILAYREGELVKSLVQLDELLDQDFETNHIRELLIDNNLIN